MTSLGLNEMKRMGVSLFINLARIEASMVMRMWTCHIPSSLILPAAMS